MVHQEVGLRHVTELIAFGADDEHRSDEVHATHAAVIRQTENASLLVADNDRIACDRYGFDVPADFPLTSRCNAFSVFSTSMISGAQPGFLRIAFMRSPS